MPGLFEIIDQRFKEMIVPDAELRHLSGGCRWAEGPVWIADEQCVLWSDIPNNRIRRWSEADGVSDFRNPSNMANGLILDFEKRLVSCEHATGRVTRTEHDGTIVTLAERYEGKRLNSPNDLCLKSDGTIWFTDPPYGMTKEFGMDREPEMDACYVYRLDPENGGLSIVVEDAHHPNGIAFSPDESVLYVSDTGDPKHIRAFDVVDGRTLANPREVAKVDPPAPDGFRIDADGNIWSSAGDGVHVFAPDGAMLGKILLPEQAANLVFGGPDRRTLFITATTSLYSIEVAAAGNQRP